MLEFRRLSIDAKTTVIGIDSSTTSTKVVAFDRTGAVISQASASYPYHAPHPGWVEQNADDWWRACCDASRTVTSELRGAGYSIEGLACTHQRFSFVPVDERFQALRPAILWNDLRCPDEAEAVRETVGVGRVFSTTGYPPGQWTLYKALWLKRHEPEIYRRTAFLMLVHDYLVYRLTGAVCTSQSSAAMTGALAIESPSEWAKELIREIGVRDDIWVEPVLPAGAHAGSVSLEGAAVTGLPEGLPVFAGAGDQPCGTLGAGVYRSGQLGTNGGTSCSNELVVERLPPLVQPDYFVEINPAGGYIIENDVPSGGSAVANWYRREFCAQDGSPACAPGADPWGVIYGALAETAPGNRGFMIVPYLQGVYGPYWDQNARAVSLGLQTDHRREHLVRALFEGVAYEARREVELMTRSTGVEVEEIRMYGGSARSDHWNQLFADVFDTVVHVPATEEATALGAALCAAVGSGAFASFGDAAEAMTRIDRTYRPAPDHASIYERYFTDVYLELYDRVSDLVARIADIETDLQMRGQAE